MKRIAITGAKGTIGSVLVNRLQDYEITPVDLPEIDVRDYGKLVETVKGHDAIVHMAWDTVTENWASGAANPDNLVMVENIYKAAVEAGVPRVIMASSVHADKYKTWEGQGLMTIDRTPEPDSPYGESKVKMEEMGREYALNGLEVVCIRFGGVNKENMPSTDEIEKKAWLSHEDCAGLVRKCLELPLVQNNFLIIYGVSDNEGRIHDNSFKYAQDKP